MRPSVAFLGGWLAACVSIAAGALAWLWWSNVGAGRHLHHHKTTPPRSVPDG